MKQEVSAGGVVYSYDPAGQIHIALIQDRYGHWGLPKGHLDAGETRVEAARREIIEEIGLTATIGPLVKRITYPVYKRGVWRQKTVDYFLARSEHTPLTPRLEEGINEAQWFTPEVALKLVTFDQTRTVLQRALRMLDGKDQSTGS